MSFEDIDRLIKTMKKHGIFSVKSPDIEIVAKAEITALAKQMPHPLTGEPQVPDDVKERLERLSLPVTDEQLLFDPYYGLEEKPNV